MLTKRFFKSTLLIIWLLLFVSMGSFGWQSVPTASATTHTPTANIDCASTKFTGKEYREKCGCGKEGVPVTKDNCGIVAYIVVFTRVLSGLVGIVVVIMLVVRGMQYIVARENPQMTAKAREGILWAVLSLIFYVFIFAALQWLVPGGVI